MSRILPLCVAFPPSGHIIAPPAPVPPSDSNATSGSTDAKLPLAALTPATIALTTSGMTLKPLASGTVAQATASISGVEPIVGVEVLGGGVAVGVAVGGAVDVEVGPTVLVDVADAIAVAVEVAARVDVRVAVAAAVAVDVAVATLCVRVAVAGAVGPSVGVLVATTAVLVAVASAFVAVGVPVVGAEVDVVVAAAVPVAVGVRVTSGVFVGVALETVGVGVAGQPSIALFTAATRSSTSTMPGCPLTNSGQALSGVMPRAMLTPHHQIGHADVAIGATVAQALSSCGVGGLDAARGKQRAPPDEGRRQDAAREQAPS